MSQGVAVPTDPESQTSQTSPRMAAVTNIDAGRRRATRLDVKIAQQAMKAVLPTNRQIGPWQARAAHLLALAEKLKATGRYDPSVADEAEALLNAVQMHRRNLDRTVLSLPADVRTSTRLEDTARALESVAGVLGRTLSLMQPGRNQATKS